MGRIKTNPLFEECLLKVDPKIREEVRKNMINKEIKELVDKIKSNQDYQLRNSEFFEPWDTSPQTISNMADSFYYIIDECLELMEKLISE